MNVPIRAEHPEQPEERYMDAARRMGLFSLGDTAGVVFWQPPGLKLYDKLRAFIRAEHEARGYQEVRTPSIAGLGMFAQSGHLEKYRENMFCLNQPNEEGLDMQGYALRPMSCPNHILLYQAVRRSWRELPMKLFEFGEVFRNEPSGSLQVLFRQRQFCQDDSHVFSPEAGMVEAARDYLEMARRVYTKLGFTEVSYAISLRPAKRFGDDALWDLAEEALREACRQADLSWQELPGEGAFYGPKIELQVKDKLGRSWQLGTLQLDFVLPRRFDLSFVNPAGEYEVPVILHHAVLGSIERMIGILLESFGTDLPLWLQPHEAVVVPVSAKALGYARQCGAIVRKTWRDALVDESDEPLGAKLRYWRGRGVPHILVVGEKEADAAARGEGTQVAVGGKPVDLSTWLFRTALAARSEETELLRDPAIARAFLQQAGILNESGDGLAEAYTA
jgi:threonyl-tRNA synthetase